MQIDEPALRWISKESRVRPFSVVDKLFMKKGLRG